MGALHVQALREVSARRWTNDSHVSDRSKPRRRVGLSTRRAQIRAICCHSGAVCPCAIDCPVIGCPKSRALATDGLSRACGVHLTWRKISSILVSPVSVQPGVRRPGDGVEEEEALRTCEELLAVTKALAPRCLATIRSSTHKLNVM